MPNNELTTTPRPQEFDWEVPQQSVTVSTTTHTATPATLQEDQDRHQEQLYRSDKCRSPTTSSSPLKPDDTHPLCTPISYYIIPYYYYNISFGIQVDGTSLINNNDSYGYVLVEFQFAIHVSPQNGCLIFCCFNAHLSVASDIRVQSHDYPSLNFHNSGELTRIQTAAENGPA